MSAAAAIGAAPPLAEERLSIRFLFNCLLDEVAERAGLYWGRPQSGLFLDGRATALACDANGGLSHVMWGRSSLWRAESYLDSPSSSVLWLRLDCIEAFVEQVLPKLSRKFVVVSTESDYAPFKWWRGAAATLIASDKVAHWFCAQCDAPEPIAKLTPVPVGILYPYRNDLQRGRDLFGARRISRRDSGAFDAKLLDLMRGRMPPYERELLALGDFCLNDTCRDGRYGETRTEIHRRLASNPAIVFPEQLISQFNLYALYSRFAFVVSPHGRGYDCYRTWEAILMGAIPIVKRSPIDAVYEGFPVVIVDDWAEITPRNLERWRDDFAGYWHDAKSDRLLTLAHWLELIREKARQIA
jgi:hypothetical protein